MSSESITELSIQLGYESENLEVNNRLLEIIGNIDNCVFVTMDGMKIVSWVHGFYSRRGVSGFFVEIGGLVVDIECRKKGIEKLLVDEINRWSCEKGCEKVRVRCNNVRKEMHIFYQDPGFVINKEQKSI